MRRSSSPFSFTILVNLLKQSTFFRGVKVRECTGDRLGAAWLPSGGLTGELLRARNHSDLDFVLLPLSNAEILVQFDCSAMRVPGAKHGLPEIDRRIIDENFRQAIEFIEQHVDQVLQRK